MGVKSLWKFLKPVARPATLESLEGKILAVDVSIWLHKAAAAMRDAQGGLIPNAHLIVLFHRICKLLFYKVRPIFVFDGKIPELKRQTMLLRGRKRKHASSKVQQVRNQIVRKKLEQCAVSVVSGGPPTAVTTSGMTLADDEEDLFKLPNDVPRGSLVTDSQEHVDFGDDGGDVYDGDDEEEASTSDYLNSIDIDGDDFKRLPPEIQHELLTQLKVERQYNAGAAFKSSLPQDSHDFSEFQLQRILGTNKLASRMKKLQERMKSAASQDIPSMDVDDWLAQGYYSNHGLLKTSSDGAQGLLLRREPVVKPEDAVEISADPDGGDDDLVDENDDELEGGDDGGFIREDEGQEMVQKQNAAAPSSSTALILPAAADVKIQQRTDREHKQASKQAMVLQEGTIEISSDDEEIDDLDIKVGHDFLAATIEEDVIAADPVREEVSNETKATIVPKEPESSSSGSEEDWLDVEAAVKEPVVTTHRPPSAHQEEAVEKPPVEGSNGANDLAARMVNPEKLLDDLREEEHLLTGERTSLRKQAHVVTDVMYSDAQQLLRLFGIPYITARNEAEAECANLDQTDQTSGTITDDSDYFLFGGRSLFKNFFSSDQPLERYLMSDVRSVLKCDRETLACMGLVCGGDYSEGVKGIGPVGLLKILDEFPSDEPFRSLQLFADWWADNHEKTSNVGKREKFRKYKLDGQFPDRRVYDAYLKCDVDQSSETFEWGTPDLESLREYCATAMGWSKGRVDEAVVPLLKRIRERSDQPRVTDFLLTLRLAEEDVRRKSTKRKGSTVASGNKRAKKDRKNKK